MALSVNYLNELIENMNLNLFVFFCSIEAIPFFSKLKNEVRICRYRPNTFLILHGTLFILSFKNIYNKKYYLLVFFNIHILSYHIIYLPISKKIPLFVQPLKISITFILLLFYFCIFFISSQRPNMYF